MNSVVYKDMETNFVPATNEDAPGLGNAVAFVFTKIKRF
jgi:hypothetical protein